ncbi:hypothetical protein EVAR_97906_1 [Eumeta japonica]|uniref:Uncharacterized protein n=1 Tax=Eumeta variegata TaxID=151549 RepID=A0A4C1WE11_EUMVA|nr:hypothetical protein EVAR_97906_1 [Eumeta japonica]
MENGKTVPFWFLRVCTRVTNLSATRNNSNSIYSEIKREREKKKRVVNNAVTRERRRARASAPGRGTRVRPPRARAARPADNLLLRKSLNCLVNVTPRPPPPPAPARPNYILLRYHLTRRSFTLDLQSLKLWSSPRNHPATSREETRVVNFYNGERLESVVCPAARPAPVATKNLVTRARPYCLCVRPLQLVSTPHQILNRDYAALVANAMRGENPFVCLLHARSSTTAA